MFKKYFAIFLVLVLCFSILGGCTTKNEESPSSTDDNQNSTTSVDNNQTSAASPEQTETVPSGPLFEQPVTLTMWTYSHPSWPYQEDWYVVKMLEEKTNVKLQIESIIGEGYGDKLTLAIATGELPDISAVGDNKFSKQYGPEGAFINVMEYVDKAPNFKKFIEANKSAMSDYMTAEGAMYQFSQKGIGLTNEMGWLYRKDIFEKNNIEPPTTSDELFTVLKQLKSIYPDSYPLTYRNKLNTFSLIGPQWGTGMTSKSRPWYLDTETDKWVYGPIEDNFKNMVEYFLKLYQEDLIPQNWLTISTKEWQDLFTNDKAFIMPDYLVRIDFFNNLMAEDNPEFEMAYMKPFVGQNGVGKTAYTTRKNMGLMVSANSKNIDKAVKFLDWWYTDEAKELLSWGEEGKTYTVENGQRKWIEAADVAGIRNKYGLSTDGLFLLYDFEAQMVTFSDPYRNALNVDKDYNMPCQPTVPFTTDENETEVEIGSAINTYMQEELSKFLLGVRPLSEWDDYVQEIKDMNVDKYIGIYQKAYERFKGKK